MYKLKSFPGGSHRKIAQILEERKPQTILDIGSDNGFVGRCLSYKPRILWAIDKRKVDLPNIYSKFSRVDIEKTDWGFLKGKKFEAIILADILEHLRNPADIVKKLKKYLTKDGPFIISLPNMGFFLVRVFNFLDIKSQMDRGLFDRTHLHRFNIKSLYKLTKDTGVKATSLQFTPVPLPLISPLFDKGRGLYGVYKLVDLLAKNYPSLFAYQFIFKAKI